MKVEIDSSEVEVCCKNKDTTMRAIYYFMVNPFRQTEDYHCKNIKGNTTETDIARFSSIGPVNISFNELIYPSCSMGTMGFNRQSKFMSLMPLHNRFYVITEENSP